jgi:hypothetical protein
MLSLTDGLVIACAAGEDYASKHQVAKAADSARIKMAEALKLLNSAAIREKYPDNKHHLQMIINAQYKIMEQLHDLIPDLSSGP